MKTIVTNNAEKIYSALNGIFVLYKPALSSVRSAKNTILKNISEGKAHFSMLLFIVANK